MADSDSFSFHRTPDSVPAARETLERLHGELSEGDLYDASLCLSELVTNAVQHPGQGDQLELELSLTDSALRVEVRDPGRGFDPGDPSAGDERGWGLFIVDQLSSRWGVQQGETTVVWFEIDRNREAAEDAEAAGRPTGDPAKRGDRSTEIANAVARLRLGGAISWFGFAAAVAV